MSVLASLRRAVAWRPDRHRAALATLLALPALVVGLALHPLTASAATTTVRHVAVCAKPTRGRVGCLAIRVDRLTRGRVQHAQTPVGLTPSLLQSAYALPSATAGTGQTIAIVDAYGAPSAAADLAVYRKAFGLPACTTATRCLRIVGQTGTSALPPADAGWGEETALDLDMASAICPHCHLLLVEATSSAQANLGAAVDTAVRLGATVVSNSYGGPDASDSSYGRYYHHAGVAVVASSGDDGYGVSYPASSKWVTAVGGTTLSRSGSSWRETAWADAGSGCSSLNHASWQPSGTTGCTGRAVADVAAVADPSTGVAVYDSTTDDGAAGWLTVGGTSASSPIVAGVFALAGNAASVKDGSWVWAHHPASGFRDITSGSNGSCSTRQLCTARRGWDGPTGWGSPHGTGGF